jgi:tRNA nucleotidyltransferase (CCA-adding enzyme)
MIFLNPAAQSALDKLRAVGGRVYVVGGAVRDTLLGNEPKDIDLVVTGVNASVLDKHPLFHRTGEHFGVYRHRLGSSSTGFSEVEVALPRTETSTGPGHKDFEVTAAANIPLDVDLARRDFTVNSMAWDTQAQKLVDPFGGRFDVDKRIVRVINKDAFSDDPLRILRAYVLMSRYSMIPVSDTIVKIADNADKLNELPAERIQAELDKIFAGDNVAKAMHLMYFHGVLHYIFPEVADNWNYNQNNPHHQKILGEHHMFTLKYIAEISDDIDVRLAGFLHDIGKPRSAWVDPETGSNHFYRKRFHVNDHKPEQFAGSQITWIDNDIWQPQFFEVGFNHEDIGADMGEARLRVLKYPEARITHMVGLIRGHMWNPFTTERGARKFLNKYGDLADDLLTLRYGDNGGKLGYDPTTPGITLNEQMDLLERVRNEAQPTRTADLAINGHDLIREGFTPGPQIGEIIEFLTDLVVDDPSLNEYKTLINAARSMP